jgi:hypothetical protein
MSTGLSLGPEMAAQDRLFPGSVRSTAEVPSAWLAMR